MNAPVAISIIDNGDTFNVVFNDMAYMVLYKTHLSFIHYRRGRGFIGLNKSVDNRLGFNQFEVDASTLLNDIQYEDVSTLLDEISSSVGVPVEVVEFEERVLDDGGEINRKVNVSKVVNFLKQNEILEDLKVLVSPTMGLSYDAVGVYNMIDKLYSLDATPLDVTQTTELLKPYLSDFIAPNQVFGMKSVEGISKVIVHTDVIINASTPWTAFVLVNWSGGEDDASIIGSNSDSESLIFLREGGENLFAIAGNNGVLVKGTEDTSPLIGKTVFVSFAFNGTDALNIYVNGVLFDTIAYASSVAFGQVMKGGLSADTSFYGKIYLYGIIGGDMSSLEPTWGNLYRSLVPEIASKIIGSQQWASENLDITMTPQGNPIDEVTDASTFAGSSDLYDTAYDAHVGTVDEKHYAGLKAAAMWRYPNSSAEVGTWGGKLYNGYALQLIDLDLQLAETGWRIPSEADTSVLESGIIEAYMKNGMDYWEDETGTNATGLSLLGTGIITETGTYEGLKQYTIIGTRDSGFLELGVPTRLIKEA